MVNKDGEDTTMLMEKSMKEIGKMILNLEGERWATQMEMSMLACGSTVKDMDKERIIIKMVQFLREIWFKEKKKG